MNDLLALAREFKLWIVNALAQPHWIEDLFGELGPLHTEPEKFENGVSTPKTHLMLSDHTTVEKFQNATITGRRKLCVHPWGLRLMTWLLTSRRLRKPPVWNLISSILTKEVRFQILPCGMDRTLTENYLECRNCGIGKIGNTYQKVSFLMLLNNYSPKWR